MTRVKPVIAARKRKKSPPRRNGNGLRQMDTRTVYQPGRASSRTKEVQPWQKS